MAQYYLGDCYEKVIKNMDEAIKYYKLSSDQGYKFLNWNTVTSRIINGRLI
jgi:TPR repeat protein